MSWWQRTKLRPEVEQSLQRIALERLRIFLPIVMIAILLALVASTPVGIPVPASVLFVNGAMMTFAIAMYIAVRRDLVPGRYVHAVAALTWLLTPINTLSSYAITDTAALVLPLMIELATAALMLDTAWTLLVTAPVVALGVPLSLAAGDAPVYPTAVVGLWIIALIMQIWVRRWTITAETHRLELEKELDERKRAEAEREKLRDQFVHAQRLDAVGTLAAGLAHDMNNILGGILAFADVLYVEATDKHVKADLARIRQEAERGAALTRSLLAFSRRGQYRRRAILLHSVLDDMMPLLSRMLGKNVSIVRHDGPPTIIDGDPAQLGQVVLNLCLNAKDAMNDTGTVTITSDEVDLAAGAVADLPAGRYAKLAIADTGCGMDAETQKRAFEPFFTTKPRRQGTGLGLALVQGIVEASGGSVGLESAPGQGSRFTLSWPALPAGAAAQGADVDRSAAPGVAAPAAPSQQ